MMTLLKIIFVLLLCLPFGVFMLNLFLKLCAETSKKK